jgi:hypothetical protein
MIQNGLCADFVDSRLHQAGNDERYADKAEYCRHESAEERTESPSFHGSSFLLAWACYTTHFKPSKLVTTIVYAFCKADQIDLIGWSVADFLGAVNEGWGI